MGNWGKKGGEGIRGENWEKGRWKASWRLVTSEEC